MTTDQSGMADFRKSLLTSPGERQDVEYKSAIPFGDDAAFGMRLVKHILGMANVGGGWIVIGYSDDTLQVDLNHSQEIAATYDTTRLSASVDKHIHGDQRIRLTVFMETHPKTQLPHPIIQVQGFERTPFICRSTKGVSDANQPILQTGKVYIRRPGAATSEIQTPAEWEDLLRRCVSQRRDEFLSEFVDLFHRMNSGDATPAGDMREALKEWMVKRRADLTTKESLPGGGGYVESGQVLIRPRDSGWTIQELRRAAVSAKLPYTEWFDSSQLVPAESGIESRTEPKAPVGTDYWHLAQDGAYFSSAFFREDYEAPFFSSSLGHPTKSLWFDLAIFRIARALLHGARLFEELRIAPNESFLVAIKHRGLYRRTIYTSVVDYPYFIDFRGTSNVDAHEWQGEVTIDLIRGQLVQLVHDIANSLFVKFEFAEVSKSLVEQTISKYQDLPHFIR